MKKLFLLPIIMLIGACVYQPVPAYYAPTYYAPVPVTVYSPPVVVFGGYGYHHWH